MTTNHCPHCNEPLPESAKMCPKCGQWAVPASEIEHVPTRTSRWQKIVIVVSVIILIAIGLSFRGAEDRENQAAQKELAAPLAALVTAQTTALGLPASPRLDLKIATKAADVFVDFSAPLGSAKAREFALAVCAGLARTYVDKGYMPRALAVHVGTIMTDGALANYGKAIFNGNLDQLAWEPATQQ